MIWAAVDGVLGIGVAVGDSRERGAVVELDRIAGPRHAPRRDMGVALPRLGWRAAADERVHLGAGESEVGLEQLAEIGRQLLDAGVGRGVGLSS